MCDYSLLVHHQGVKKNRNSKSWNFSPNLCEKTLPCIESGCLRHLVIVTTRTAAIQSNMTTVFQYEWIRQRPHVPTVCMWRSLKKKKKPVFYWGLFYVYLLCMCVYALHTSEYRCPRKPTTWGPLELQLQEIMSCLLWMLEIQLRSSQKGA